MFKIKTLMKEVEPDIWAEMKKDRKEKPAPDLRAPDSPDSSE